MSTLKELNGRVMEKPYMCGYCPSKEDASVFAKLFGEDLSKTQNVLQWAARMASYYACERESFLKGNKCISNDKEKSSSKSSPKPAAPEDDVDLFGEETEEDKAALEAKKAKDAEKKKAKKDVIAKSSILMDIKPWDDTTDLGELQKKLHAVKKDGLVWGDFKLVPIAFGIKKLQQLIVIEDEKVSGEDLEDMIVEDFKEYVQSMDIVAWNKI